MRRRRAYIAFGVAVAAGGVATAITAAIHENPAAISVSDAPSAGTVGTAATYPSIITVSGESTYLSHVKVGLFGFSQGFSDDIDVLLQSPSGATVVLMSDAGDGNSVSGLNLTFDDSALNSLPDETPPSTGVYKPTNYGKSPAPACSSEPSPDVFPSPAPGGPYGSTLSVFNGALANGDWKLYVVDDCQGDVGFVANGWLLSLTSTPTAVAVRTFTGRPLPAGAELTWRTATETDLAGFYLFRSGAGRTIRLNAKLIPAKHAGQSSGAAYRVVDRRTRTATSYTYRLQVVKLDGTRAGAGLVALRTG